MEHSEITLADLVDILNRRRLSLILPFAAVLLIAAVVALMLPSIYRSEATILIEQQEIPADFVTSTVTSYAEQRIQSINQRIMSFTRLLDIIQQYGLYPELQDRYTTEEIVEKMRDDTQLIPVSADIIDRRTGRPTTATIAFTLSYEGQNPQKVQQVTNVLASLLLQENLKERVQQVEDTSAFLQTESDKLRAEISTLEQKIADFKLAHMNELPEMLQVNQQSLNNIERNIETVNQQLRSLKERKEYLQTQLTSMEAYVEDEEELVARRRLEEVRVHLVALTRQYSDEYPDVKKARAEIKELEQKLTRLAQNKKGPPDNPSYIALAAQLASTKAEIQSINRQLADLKEDAATYRLHIANTPGVEDEYNDLVNTRNSTQAKHEDLMGKLMEARVAHGLEKEQKGERFTIIDPPRLPEKPFKPNRLAIVLIGLVLGVGAGVGCAALLEFSDDSVYKSEALAGSTSFPVLADIPEIVTDQDKKNLRTRKLAVAIGSLWALIIGVVVFHFWVMDLNVFWAKLMRRLTM